MEMQMAKGTVLQDTGHNDIKSMPQTQEPPVATAGLAVEHQNIKGSCVQMKSDHRLMKLTSQD